MRFDKIEIWRGYFRLYGSKFDLNGYIPWGYGWKHQELYRSVDA